MQVVDSSGNVFGQGLEITDKNGKPKVPVINTDITIGTTAIVGGVAGRLLFDDAGIVGETNGVHWDKVNSRLGLGTTTPTQTLDIQGNISIGLSAATTVRAYYNSTTRNQQIYTNTSSLEFFQSITERMRLAPGSGNLLLNTTTDAGFRLDVNGTARISGNITFGGTIGSGGSSNLIIAAGNASVEVQTTNPNLPTGSIITTGAITRTDSGVKSIINVNNAVTSTAANFNTLNGFAFTSTISQTLGTIRGIYIAPTLTASTDFRAIETTNGNVIFNGGNVGIGTTSPTSILDAVVSNGAKSGIRFRGYSDASTPYLLSLGTYTYSDIFQITSVNGLVSLNNTSLYALALGTNNTERLRITSTGNVLINTTTNAGYKLDVNGSSRIIGADTGTIGSRVLTLEGSLPELFFKDTFAGAQSFALSKYGSAFYFSNTSSTGTFLNYAGAIISQSWSLGHGGNPSATVHVKGAGLNSSTTSLRVQNSTAVDVLTVRDDMYVTVKNTNNATCFEVVGVNTDARILFTPSGATSNIFLRSQGSTLTLSTTANSFADVRAGYSVQSLRIGVAAGNYGGNLYSYVGDSSSGFYWRTINGSSVEVDKMLLTTGGNLLIGTTTDAGYKLDVNGNTRSNRFYATDGITLQRISFEGFNNQVGIDYNSTSGLFKFFASGNNFLSAGWNLDTIIAPVRNSSGGNFGDVVINVGGSERARFKNTGNLLINTTTDVASSQLTIESTTKGFLPPRMSNAQMLAIATPATSLMVYDTTNNKLCCYDGTTWQNLF